MRVLMFGWEFPPYMSGGLGTACFGLTKGLVTLGHEVVFVLPKLKENAVQSHVKLLSASHIPLNMTSKWEENLFKGLDIRLVNSILRPYMDENQYTFLRQQYIIHGKSADDIGGGRLGDISGEYGPNLISEVVRYGMIAGSIAKNQSFDIIHAHDWMTIFAGCHAKAVTGKPFILHIHALEFDRSGEQINQEIYDIERHGMESADHIIAVSHYTKDMMIHRYGIDHNKISVIHNAVSRTEAHHVYHVEKKSHKKIVLFLGRITFQKGPDYFIEAAAKVLKALPDTTFVMAGIGDMMPRMIERVAELRIGKNFHFTGFLKGDEIEKIFTMSDLYIMPSVSEPFGISPLEAMLYDVPVIISKQSGVSEIIRHALKVDFWDIKEIANKIIAILKYPALREEIVKKSREEIQLIRWESAAEKTLCVYRQLLTPKTADSREVFAGAII